MLDGGEAAAADPRAAHAELADACGTCALEREEVGDRRTGRALPPGVASFATTSACGAVRAVATLEPRPCDAGPGAPVLCAPNADRPNEQAARRGAEAVLAAWTPAAAPASATAARACARWLYEPAPLAPPAGRPLYVPAVPSPAAPDVAELRARCSAKLSNLLHFRLASQRLADGERAQLRRALKRERLNLRKLRAGSQPGSALATAVDLTQPAASPSSSARLAVAAWPIGGGGDDDGCGGGGFGPAPLAAGSAHLATGSAAASQPVGSRAVAYATAIADNMRDRDAGSPSPAASPHGQSCCWRPN